MSVGDEVVSLTMKFINNTNMKKFINNEVNVGSMLINYVSDEIEYFDCYTKLALKDVVCEDIRVSLIALNNLYNDRSTFLYSEFKDFLEYTYLPHKLKFMDDLIINLHKYYIISLLIYMLDVDKRLLLDDEDWMKITLQLNNKIIFYKTFITKKETLQIRNIRILIEQYILSTRSIFLQNNLFTLMKKHSNEYLQHIISSMRLF